MIIVSLGLLQLKLNCDFKFGMACVVMKSNLDAINDELMMVNVLDPNDIESTSEHEHENIVCSPSIIHIQISSKNQPQNIYNM